MVKPSAKEPPAAQGSVARVSSRRLIGNSGALVLAQLGTALLQLVALAVVTRFLGPGRYGSLVTARAYTSVIAVVADAGIATMALRNLAAWTSVEERREHASDMLAVSVRATVAVSVIGWLLLLLLFPQPSDTATRSAGEVFLLCGLVAPVTGICSAMAVNADNGYLIAAGQLAGAVFGTAASVVAVSVRLGFVGVAISQGSASLVTAVTLVLLVRPMIRPSRRVRSPRSTLLDALPMGAVNSINVLYVSADVLLLSWLGTRAAVGAYGVAYRVVALLISLPSLFMINVQPLLVRSISDQPRFRAVVDRALETSRIAAVALAVLFVRFGHDVAFLLGGRRFHHSGPLVSILVVGVAISFQSGVIGPALLALGRQRLLLYSQSAAAVVNIAINLVVIPRYGALGAAWAFVASETLVLFIMALLYRQFSPIGFGMGVRHVSAILTLIVVAYATRKLGPSSPVANLAVWGTLDVVVFGAAIFIGERFGQHRAGGAM